MSTEVPTANYLEHSPAFIEAAQENARALIKLLPQLSPDIKKITPKARKGLNPFKKDAPELEAAFLRTQARDIVELELKNRLLSITDKITPETLENLCIEGGRYFSQYDEDSSCTESTAKGVTQYFDEHPEKVEFLGQKAVLEVLYDACIEIKNGIIELSDTYSAPIGLDMEMLPKYLKSAVKQYCDALFERIEEAYYHDSDDIQTVVSQTLII